MTTYSETALRHVDELVAHFRKNRRPEAIRNLVASLRRAETLIAAGPFRPRQFPATYGNLARPGRARIKEGRYWIAYDQTDPPNIVSVFWEAADLSTRYQHVP